jgi:hypothetical protein
LDHLSIRGRQRSITSPPELNLAEAMTVLCGETCLTARLALLKIYLCA